MAEFLKIQMINGYEFYYLCIFNCIVDGEDVDGLLDFRLFLYHFWHLVRIYLFLAKFTKVFA